MGRSTQDRDRPYSKRKLRPRTVLRQRRSSSHRQPPRLHQAHHPHRVPHTSTQRYRSKGSHSTRQRLHRIHLSGQHPPHHDVLHQEGTLLLDESIQHPRRLTHRQRTSHPEPSQHRHRRQSHSLHLYRRHQRRRVGKQSQPHLLHTPRHHQEDSFRQLLTPTPKRHHSHLTQRRRRSSRSAPHQRTR